MRIFQAIKYHFQKHMLDYGIVSAVVTLVGAFMIDKVVQWLFKLAHHDYMLTVILCFVYALVMLCVAMPMIISVCWIFDRKK